MAGTIRVPVARWVRTAVQKASGSKPSRTTVTSGSVRQVRSIDWAALVPRGSACTNTSPRASSAGSSTTRSRKASTRLRWVAATALARPVVAEVNRIWARSSGPAASRSSVRRPWAISSGVVQCQASGSSGRGSPAEVIAPVACASRSRPASSWADQRADAITGTPPASWTAR